MRLLADEHIPPAVTNALRSDGHDVSTVAETVGSGTDDPDITDHARSDERVILTHDTDFLDQSIDHPGVIYATTLDDPSGIAGAIRRIETLDIDMNDRIEFAPGSWL